MIFWTEAEGETAVAGDFGCLPRLDINVFVDTGRLAMGGG